ncbi:hypothetical protein [Roseicella aerolata]|uniref:Uncharacterized protein n=1 Tax=Roseicella aerolata TaxID=2883479 RepID=A0A9X1LDD2_9PROT|nr:hypothetical protein [Roseicella aerolata]MCB4824978.1 hypothetical protein [Roseicella aerolata]
MLFQLLGTVVLGVAAAGVLLVAYRTLGRRAPRWILPVAAGAAMLGFHIWSEYTWFRRTAAALPPPLTVAMAPASTSIIQPWTLVVPRVERFAAIDPRAIRWNERAPGLRMVEVFLIARYMPTFTTLQLFDCATPRRADVPRDLALDPGDMPQGAVWVELDPADPLRRAVCAAPL